jgi:hypothetical protein
LGGAFLGRATKPPNERQNPKVTRTVGELKAILNAIPDDTNLTFEIEDEEDGDRVLEFKEVNDAFLKEEGESGEWGDFPSMLTIILKNSE